MFNFNRLTMKVRLMLVIAPLTLVLAALGAIGLYGLNRSNIALRSVYQDGTVDMSYLTKVDQLMARSRGDAARSLFIDGDEILTESADKITEKVKDIDEAANAFMEGHHTAEEATLADEFSQQMNRYLNEALVPASVQLRNHDREKLRAIYLDKVEPYYTATRAPLAKLQEIQVQGAKDEYEQAVAYYNRMRVLFLALIALSVAYGAGAGMLLVRNLMRELGGEPGYAREAVRRIAAGDLATPIEMDGHRDGSLLHALQQMREQLSGIVSQIKLASDAILTAASEIATGNQDLSSRTEEQASSLEETASSMEELTSTVKQNAENAKQANQLARGAADVAQKGGGAVNQVVTTMSAITESSKKVVDIISVIDGIAFQTNILALNAAVEAARAGEQGRGFAVVAAEVRSLAQRSAGAAKEIKALISDSVEKVQNGSQLVANAGKTMDEIVTSVKRVTDIMGEITAASQEQSSGIEQVNTTVTQMDQVTQQNAALVEEAAASAKSLEDQAEGLARSVSAFKLAGGEAPQAAAPTPRPVKPAAGAIRVVPARPKADADFGAVAHQAVAAGVNGHGTEAREWTEY